MTKSQHESFKLNGKTFKKHHHGYRLLDCLLREVQEPDPKQLFILQPKASPLMISHTYFRPRFNILSRVFHLSKAEDRAQEPMIFGIDLQIQTINAKTTGMKSKSQQQGY